ncbi:MAG: hypothetical protein ACE5DM_03165 [Candidatus Nanoarchaeia archaeon]
MKKETFFENIWKHVSIVIFSDRHLKAVVKKATLNAGLICLAVIAAILAFPTDNASMVPSTIVQNFLVVAGLLLLAEAVCFIVMRLFEAKASFNEYLGTVNSALLMSVVVVSIPIAIVSMLIFTIILKDDNALRLFFSMIPYYNYLVFGWATEKVADLKEYRSTGVAVIALVLILGANILMSFLLL